MALPVISNNSPSAGRIAWTAFAIVWDGVSYPVAAGNTNQPYTWWEYRNGTPAVVSGATLPALGLADLLLFLNKNGLGIVAPLTDVVEGSLIVPGTIMGTAIAANEIQTDHLRAGSVTAPTIAGGAVTAEKLSVGAVSDSRVVNGSFEDGVQGWERMAGTGVADVVTGVASAGANALRLTRGTTDNLHVGTALDKAIPVTSSAGRAWYIAARAGAGTALPDGFYLRAYWYQANRTTAASTAFTDIASNQPLSTSWAMFEGQATPPANARYMRIVVINARSGSVMYVDEITAREVVMSAQIGEGQITTPLLAADAIDGKTITGATMRTAASGQRMQFDTNGLRAYNPSGQVVATLAAGIGSLAIAGSMEVRRADDALASSVLASDTISTGRQVPSGANYGPATTTATLVPRGLSVDGYNVQSGATGPLYGRASLRIDLPYNDAAAMSVLRSELLGLKVMAPKIRLESETVVEVAGPLSVTGTIGVSEGGLRDLSTGLALEPILAGTQKGTTTIVHGQWYPLNTGENVGTTMQSDGYGFGSGAITVPRPGIYEISASVIFAGSSAGNLRGVGITADGQEISDSAPRNDYRFSSLPSNSLVLNVTGVVRCQNAFNVRAYQNTGSNMGGVVLGNIFARRVG